MRQIPDTLKEAMSSGTAQCGAAVKARYPVKKPDGTTYLTDAWLYPSSIQTIEISRSINGGTFAIGTADAASVKITLLKSAVFTDAFDIYDVPGVSIYLGYYTGEKDEYRDYFTLVKNGFRYLVMGHFDIDKTTIEVNGLFVSFEAYDEMYWLGFKAPVKSIDSMKRTVGIATRLSYMDYFIGSGKGLSARKSDGSKWATYDLECTPTLSESLASLLQTSYTTFENNLKVSTRYNNLKVAHRSEYLFDFNHCEGSVRDLIARLAAFCGTSAYIGYNNQLYFRQIANEEQDADGEDVAPDFEITPSNYNLGDVSFDKGPMKATGGITEHLIELQRRCIMNVAVEVPVTSSSRSSNTDAQRWVNGAYGSESATVYDDGVTLTLPSNIFRYAQAAGDAGNSFDLDSTNGKESVPDSAYNGAGIDFKLAHMLAEDCGLARYIHIEGFSATVYGFLQAELLDSVKITDVDGGVHYVRPLCITTTYDGVIKTTLSANSISDEELSSGGSSSSTVSVIPAASMTDCIVAQGICDFWTWRMWASGVAECWGTTSSIDVSVSNSWGGVYESGEHNNGYPGNTSLTSLLTFKVEIEGITYNKLFISVDYCEATFAATNYSCWVECPRGGNTLTTPTVVLVRPSSATVTGRYVYHTVGRWK